MNHYVYYSYEEWGRGYIGVRSCNCLPEEDTKYFGSFRDKTFKPTGKTILFVCETRIEAAEIEIELHKFFDVAVNPQFANKAKQTNTGFSMAGVPRTEAQKRAHSERMSGENNPNYGFPKTEEWKKAMSEKMIGKNVGKTRTEEQKRRNSETHSGENNPNYGRTGEKHPMYGRTGALNPRSRAIIAIEPDGTQRHFVSGREAARGLEMNPGNLYTYLNTGHVLTRGPFKGWQFLFKNS